MTGFSIDIDENGEIISSDISEVDENENENSENELENSENVVEIDNQGNIISENENENDDEDNENNVEAKGNKGPSVNTSSPSLINDIASAFHTDGFFQHITEEDIKNVNDVKDLGELVKKELEAKSNNDLPSEAKTLIQGLKMGIPWNELINSKKSELEYQSITDDNLKGDDNLALRKKVMSDYYTFNTRFSEEKINELITKSIDTGTDEKDAINMLKEIKPVKINEVNSLLETKKQEDLNKQKKRQEEYNTLNNLIKESNSIIDGLELNDKIKEDVYKSISDPSVRLKDYQANKLIGQYYKDPSYKIKLHYLQEITKDFTDFSIFSKKAETSALAKLSAKIDKQNIKNSNSTSTVSSSTLEEMDDLLDRI